MGSSLKPWELTEEKAAEKIKAENDIRKDEVFTEIKKMARTIEMMNDPSWEANHELIQLRDGLMFWNRFLAECHV